MHHSNFDKAATDQATALLVEQFRAVVDLVAASPSQLFGFDGSGWQEAAPCCPAAHRLRGRGSRDVTIFPDAIVLRVECQCQVEALKHSLLRLPHFREREGNCLVYLRTR